MACVYRQEQKHSQTAELPQSFVRTAKTLRHFPLDRYNAFMTEQPLLDNISIVLVRTKTPGNIGAVARCMMNFGLSRLVLVRPPADRDEDALRIAAGAEEIIHQARRFDTLADAVTGHQLVIGTSRHRGRLRKNVRSPRRLAEELLPLLAENKVALVFGREVNGLDRADLALCQELVAIPSSDAFPSLNLSHAVAVVAYELFIASLAFGKAPLRTATRFATSRELEQFYDHLQTTLQDIGFLDTNQPERMMATLRGLFGRARPDSRDISILRGILTGVDQAAKKRH